MTSAVLLLLREIPDANLIEDQNLAYPVVRPGTVAAARKVLACARNTGHRVMIMGTGSSFSGSFVPSTNDIIALFTAHLDDSTKSSEFTSVVMAGTRLDRIVIGAGGLGRRTIGGLLCDGSREHKELQNIVWKRIIRIKVLGSDGSHFSLAGPRGMIRNDAASGNMLLGSQGRLGVITSVELAGQVPFHVSSVEIPNHSLGGGDVEDTVLSYSDLRALFDTDGLFQW